MTGVGRAAREGALIESPGDVRADPPPPLAHIREFTPLAKVIRSGYAVTSPVASSSPCVLDGEPFAGAPKEPDMTSSAMKTMP